MISEYMFCVKVIKILFLSKSMFFLLTAVMSKKMEKISEIVEKKLLI